MEFKSFGKIARWSRDIVITEKLDGTNAAIYIGENGEFLTASRNRFITPEDDNYGFSKWAHQNKDELMQLGVGIHYGEWWGAGIARRYDMDEKIFSLFNVGRWNETSSPSCCRVVPTLYIGENTTAAINETLLDLKEHGSVASRGFMNPEGVIIWHTAANIYFKKTILNDESYKGAVK